MTLEQYELLLENFTPTDEEVGLVLKIKHTELKTPEAQAFFKKLVDFLEKKLREHPRFVAIRASAAYSYCVISFSKTRKKLFNKLKKENSFQLLSEIQSIEIEPYTSDCLKYENKSLRKNYPLNRSTSCQSGIFVAELP